MTDPMALPKATSGMPRREARSEVISSGEVVATLTRTIPTNISGTRNFEASPMAPSTNQLADIHNIPMDIATNMRSGRIDMMGIRITRT